MTSDSFPAMTELSLLREAIRALLSAGPTPDEAHMEAFIQRVRNASDSDRTAQLTLDLFLEPHAFLSGKWQLTDAAKSQIRPNHNGT